jgi:hypothetical protein
MVSPRAASAQAVTLLALLVQCHGFAPAAVHQLTQKKVLKHALPARRALHSARSIRCSLAERATAAAFSYDDAISPLISSIAPSKTIEVLLLAAVCSTLLVGSLLADIANTNGSWY